MNAVIDMIPFYDDYSSEPATDGWVDIERIYCFDWDLFDPALMNELRKIFTRLPSSIKQDSQNCYWWYSDHEDLDRGYLTAGMEPPGLQVFGTLQVDDWRQWDLAFQEQASHLPIRNLDQPRRESHGSDDK